MDNEYLEQLQRVINCKSEVVTFLHNTKTRQIAEKILQEGFEFQSHLDYTSDVVSAKDPVTIKYFTLVRQAYGDYTVIIQIDKNLIEEYSNILEDLPHHFSEILTVKPPYIGNEDDLIYCLAPHFVKGYVNAQTAEFFSNSLFNAGLKIPIFEKNLNKLLAAKK